MVVLGLRRNGRILIAAAFATTLYAFYTLFYDDGSRYYHGVVQTDEYSSTSLVEEPTFLVGPEPISLVGPKPTSLVGSEPITSLVGSEPTTLIESEPAVDSYTPLPSHVADLFAPLDKGKKIYREWNAQTMRELHSCIALRNCGRNQKKVILLSSHWIEDSVIRGGRGGEGIWSISMYKHLCAMGYTIFFSLTLEEVVEQYRQFPDLVKVVIRHWAGECHADPECVKGPSNPTGIPAWKIFDFEYFASVGDHPHAHPLKGKWILSATPEPNMDIDEAPMQYIGYSIEDECRSRPVVPLSERSNQAWLLMKQIKYVYDNRHAWDRSFFSRAAKETGLTLIGGWLMDQHYGGWNPETDGEMKDIAEPGNGVVNLGHQDAGHFMNQVGMSKVMIGLGNPWLSPSPFNALCQGVPFINPIIYWDENRPDYRGSWNSQHPNLNQYDPPYVYHVHARNWTGFVEAIKAASTTEIPSFIPDYMTEMAVRERVRKLMETDWRSKAAELLEQRLKEVKEGKNVYTFEL